MVTQFVTARLLCQRVKYDTQSPTGLLQPLRIPQNIQKHIALDFITGLPHSTGTDCILVIIDRLSKYGHFIPLKHPFTAKSIAEIFTKEIIRQHGIP